MLGKAAEETRIKKVLEDLKGHYEYKVFMLWYVQ